MDVFRRRPFIGVGRVNREGDEPTRELRAKAFIGVRRPWYTPS